MKSIKMFAVAACAFLATACSNSDDEKFTYNTVAGVTVEMGDVTAEFTENQGVVTIPVNVIGEPNGYVTVTIECQGVGESPAIPNRRFYLTSDKLNISKYEKTVDVEFSLVDNRGLDDAQTFICTIVSAQGATVGAQNTTTVTINDKGSSPLYTELAGDYMIQTNAYALNMQADPMTFDDLGDMVYDVRVTLGTPDGKGGGTLLVSGVLGQYTMELIYDYDPEEKYGELVFNSYGYPAGVYGPYDLIWCNESGKTEGLRPVVGTWNSTYTSCTFGSDDSMFYVGIFDNGQYINAPMGAMSKFTLIRIPD